MNNLLRSKKLLAALAITASVAVILPLAVSAAGTVFAGTNQNPGVVGRLEFQGSTTVGPIIQAAAADYNSYVGKTVITNDSTNIDQDSSGPGRESALLHYTDIGMASSKASTTLGSGVYDTSDSTFGETATGLTEAQLLTQTDIARDGVVLIVNKSVPSDITQLTEAQIVDIYDGYITNWDQISGNSADNMKIVPRARIIGSGTRQSLSDQTKGMGSSSYTNTTITFMSPDSDSSPTPGTENYTIIQTGLARESSNQQMEDDINLSTSTGQIGYVGLGFDTDSNVRDMNVVDSNNVAWSPTGQNIYAANPARPGYACYPLARFLYLYTPAFNTVTSTSTTLATATPFTPANESDISSFLSWITQLNGKGQADVVSAGFLTLVPGEDVNNDGTVNVLDLIQVGNCIGEGGAQITNIRADVNGDGTVNVLDLIQVGNWIGTNILPLS